MALRLLREFRDLTDLEFAELWAEVNAERERRFGPRANLEHPDAAEAESGPAPRGERKFFQCRIWYTKQGRTWHTTRGCSQLVHSQRVTESIISGYVDPDDTYFSGFITFSRRSPCEVCIPDVWEMLLNQNPHLAVDGDWPPAAEGSRRRARQRARAAGRHGATVRWVEVGAGEDVPTLVAVYSEGEESR